MSNDFQDNWEDEDDFDMEEEDQQVRKPQGNDLVKQLRKSDRAKEKRIREMEAELASLRSERRTQTVSQILANEGVSPRIAKYIPADITDEGAIKAWLDENAEDFNINRSQNDGAGAPDEDALGRMNNLTDGALGANAFNDIESLIDAAQTPEEVAAILARLDLQ